MVESVDDIKSSRSIRGTHGPDFEVEVDRQFSALAEKCTRRHDGH